MPYGTVPGVPVQMVKLVLVFFNIWQENVAKIPKVPGTPLNVNPAQAITWLTGVTIYVMIFQQQFTSTSPVFTRQKSFERNQPKENMLIEQIIEFELKGPGPPGRACTSTTD